MRIEHASNLGRRLGRQALRSVLLCGIAATPFVAGTAAAQTAPAASEQAGEVEEVVVTGVRAAIQSSIQQKKNATVVSDVLAADDIGDLPALSIGEAIETITGAATHREKGGASEIAVRGLGPYLGSTTFNGREATNGSGDRSVNFSMFPSELINTVAIYKSQRADFVEGGVAGIIDMQTLKPLDFGKRRIQLEGRGIYQGYDQRLADENGLGWRGTFSYVDQFDVGALGRIGLSVGVQKGKSNNPEELFSSSSTWSACNATIAVGTTANCTEVSPGSYASGATPAGTPFYLTTGSRTFIQFNEHDDRESVFTALQWRPNDDISVNFDYQQSTYEFIEARQQLNLSETMRGYGSSAVYTDEGVLQKYSGNSTLESTPLYRDQIEQYEGGGLNVAWDATDRLSLALDYGWSDTFRSRMDREVRLRSNATDIYGVAVPGVINGQRVAYTFDATQGDVPTITLNPLFDVNDADNFSAAARLRRTEQVREDEITATRLDGTYRLADTGLLDVKFGARRSEHEFRDINQDRREYNITSASAIASANLACRLPQFPQSDFLSDASGKPITSWATFDSICLFENLIGTADPGRNADTRAIGNRDMTETTTAFYALADFDTELAGMPLSGNFGLRYVKTEVQSTGLRGGFDVITNPDSTIQLVSNGQFDTLTFDSESEEWLPSVNLALDVTEKARVRLGLFRAMSRPDPEDLGAGRTINLESGTSFATPEDAIRSVTANGNPAMTPLMSWNADLSFEYYLNRDSMFSAAVFLKKFQGGFENVVVNDTYTIDGQSVTVPVIVTETSDEESDIFGFELTGAHRFSNLPAPFDGLGVKASYSYADSSFETEDLRLGDQTDAATGVVTPGIIDPVDIFGLSKHVFSGSLYYEMGPIELQGIVKYRSGYYQQFVGAAAQNRVVREATVMDFRASYRVNDNLSFSFEGSNLNNEPRVEDMPIPGSVREVHLYGPRYYLGARYRF
ncbi:TonB-dependent receptor [Caulobacter sp. 17J80-11]|uniref:TonB-dependent receptor n=1 Tax=Caulobacter sp. 17J80-11 TaxID=2763502 RepID=UPI001653C259|nr:TonB-dependent receptor [Caulobacter sp. 17J80-11]MBC6983426.1 TonB-dependent receptor [Caulobacter sp. 17J80-11]